MATVSLIPLFIHLGQWQAGKAERKTTLQATLDQRMREAPQDFSAEMGEMANPLNGKDDDLLALTGTADQRAELLAHLRDNAAQAHIYLIDPHGNAILRYPQDVDPSGICKDLTHLLKHSWVG